MNLFKQRARVLRSTSECERMRIVGCEKAAGGTLGKEPPRGASWGSQCSSEYRDRRCLPNLYSASVSSISESSGAMMVASHET